MSREFTISQPVPDWGMGTREALVLLAAILSGIYTALPLPIGGVLYIPFVILFGVTLYLLAFHFDAMDGTDLTFLGGMALLLLLNLHLSATPFSFMGDQLKAFVQIMAGLLLGIFTAKIIQTLPRPILEKFLVGAILLVFAVVLLERTGLLRGLSDSWREAVYTGVFTEPYANDVRDLELVGFIRPKAFTAEPAFLAGFVFVVLNSLALLARRLSVVGLAALLAFSGYFLVGSPILILATVSIILIILLRFSSGVLLILVPVLVATAFLLVSPRADDAFDRITGVFDRFEGLAEGRPNQVGDASARSRLVVPFTRTVPESIALNPVFGIGIGGKEYFSRQLDSTYSSRDTTAGKHEMTMGTNALGNLIATLGFGGFAILLVLTAGFLVHRYGFLTPVFLPAVLLFTFTRGAYETQAFWAAVFLMAGCAYAAHSASGPPSAPSEPACTLQYPPL